MANSVRQSQYSQISVKALNADSASHATTSSYAVTASHALNSGGSPVTIKDEGVTKTTGVTVIDFTGAGVTATNVGSIVTVNIPGGGGGSTDTGSLLTTASVNLNTITFTKGNGSTFPITVNTGSGGSTPTLQQVVNTGNGISNFGGVGNASMQSTNFTNNRTLYLNDNAYPTIRLVDNANASNYLQIDIDTLNIDGTSYNWSTIVNPPTVDTSSLATTGSNVFIGNQTISGSLFVSGAVSASFGSNTVGFFGTASWAQSASQALTASYINPSVYSTGSYTGSFTGSLFGTASWATNALTASLAPNYVLNSATSSFATTGSNSFRGSQSITGSLVVSGSGATIELYGDKIIAGTVGGDEGGEILLGKPDTNTTLTGSGVTIDSYQNKIRFFEQGGTARGAYIDITACGAGVGTNLSQDSISLINNTNVQISTTVSYISFCAFTTNSVEAARQIIVPVAGSIKNLYVLTSTSQPAGGPQVCIVRKNGANTSLTASISAGAAAGTFSDTTNSVSVAAGDKLSLQISSSVASSATIVSVAAIIERS